MVGVEEVIDDDRIVMAAEDTAMGVDIEVTAERVTSGNVVVNGRSIEVELAVSELMAVVEFATEIELAIEVGRVTDDDDVVDGRSMEIELAELAINVEIERVEEDVGANDREIEVELAMDVGSPAEEGTTDDLTIVELPREEVIYDVVMPLGEAVISEDELDFEGVAMVLDDLTDVVEITRVLSLRAETTP